MRRHTLLPLLCLLLTATSCNVYHQQAVDIPLLQEKGDLQADISAGMTEAMLFGLSANANVSYAVSQHIGVQAYGDFSSPDLYYMQGAAGGFFPMSKNFVMEAYAGMGIGQGKINGKRYIDTQQQGYLHSTYNEAFVQWDAGFVALANSHLDVGLGVRAGEIFGQTSEYCYYAPTDNEITYREQHLFAEPQLMLRVGWEHFKFSFKFGGCLIDGEEEVTRHFPIHNLNFGLGISYRL